MSAQSIIRSKTPYSGSRTQVEEGSSSKKTVGNDPEILKAANLQRLTIPTFDFDAVPSAAPVTRTRAPVKMVTPETSSDSESDSDSEAAAAGARRMNELLDRVVKRTFALEAKRKELEDRQKIVTQKLAAQAPVTVEKPIKTLDKLFNQLLQKMHTSTHGFEAIAQVHAFEIRFKDPENRDRGPDLIADLIETVIMPHYSSSIQTELIVLCHHILAKMLPNGTSPRQFLNQYATKMSEIRRIQHGKSLAERREKILFEGIEDCVQKIGDSQDKMGEQVKAMLFEAVERDEKRAETAKALVEAVGAEVQQTATALDNVAAAFNEQMKIVTNQIIEQEGLLRRCERAVKRT